MNSFYHYVTIWRLRVIILFWLSVLTLQKGWEEVTDLYDAYEFDTSVQPFKAWLSKRLRRNQRDPVDALARRLLNDFKIPRHASKSMYAARMRQWGYSKADLQAFETAWSEMRTEQIGE
jgi:hypothetical protein